MSDGEQKYRNTLTGKVAVLTDAQYGEFAEHYEPVDDDAKPFAAGLFDAGTVTARAANRTNLTTPAPSAAEKITEGDEPEADGDEGDPDEAPAESTEKKGK